ncbi:putative PKS/NRPS-like protein biosynthetic cluster [Pleurotus pulmonarius]|nr:putative PKS/NRPS-like protein biosynthetic cluster [Pleurotus pulmonarius]
MQRLATQTLEKLTEDRYHGVKQFEMPLFPQLYDVDDQNYPPVVAGKMTKDTPVLILHSSGSTAFPKPIRMTNYAFLQWGILPYYGDVDICGVPIATHALPMFRRSMISSSIYQYQLNEITDAMGAIGMVWSSCAGSVVACFRPSSPPVLPTPDVFLKAIVDSGSRIVYCVPSFVEAWALDQKNIPLLRNLTAIVYAGAPLNVGVGTALSREGVTLIPFYGSTEIGCFNLFLAKDPSKEDWQYFEPGRHMKLHRVLHEGIPGAFEPVIIASSSSTPHTINTVIDGQPAYATSDLLEVHPHKPHLVRVYGRVDDQLMLSTGEKTNPTPLETILVHDENISAAIMFGRGRFQNGVLIQPTKEFDPSDEESLADFRNKIWPSVEKLNEFAPTHSRLFKEMIIVTNPSKPLEYTPKGTPRRQVCLAAYAAEVDALYEAVEESSQRDITPPQEWTPEETLRFIRKVVGSVMVAPITDEEDFFQSGCDSLQATWIRNTVLRSVRVSSNVSVHHIPQNFVYTYPTIHLLSGFVHTICSGLSRSRFDTALLADKAREMHQLVDKYGSHMVARSLKEVDNEGRFKVTLLTGSSGRFGSYILANLLQRKDVNTLFVLIRNLSNSSPLVRQEEAFNRWGLDVTLLNDPKLIFLEGDLSQQHLGLGVEAFDKIFGMTTLIIHNAWQVDFNMTLSSFEPLIVGTRNAIDFALAARRGAGAHLTFVSSISVLRGCPPQHPAQETINCEALQAVGTGYSESKWVAEQLIRRASEVAGLSSTVIRVGQLSGDSLTGAWNPKEWVPAIVGMSQLIGKLVSWLPVDVAAPSLLELVEAGAISSNPEVFHLISPNPVSWDAIFQPIAETLRLPLVPYDTWLSFLEAASTSHGAGKTNVDHNAALSLLEFFKVGYFGAGQANTRGKAAEYSASLTNSLPLSIADVMQYVRHWQKIGHIAIESGA